MEPLGQQHLGFLNDSMHVQWNTTAGCQAEPNNPQIGSFVHDMQLSEGAFHHSKRHVITIATYLKARHCASAQSIRLLDPDPYALYRGTSFAVNGRQQQNAAYRMTGRLEQMKLTQVQDELNLCGHEFVVHGFFELLAACRGLSIHAQFKLHPQPLGLRALGGIYADNAVHLQLTQLNGIQIFHRLLRRG
jgi:hypothetical protein